MPLTRSLAVFLLVASTLLLRSSCLAKPYVHDPIHNVSYQGLTTSPGVEAFLGITYGASTAGSHRFAPPRPFSPPPGHVFNVTVAGPSCPQTAGAFSILAGTITDSAEDCLNLNVARPAGWNYSQGLLPVMVWIYGGGLNSGSANDASTAPDGLVLQSVGNGHPVLYVAMNYRLNIFGFAASEALRGSKSLNNGLKDQRLALEWVQENIEAFGGDPTRVTIFGQSSGGLSVGLQVLAYGASKPVPFHSAIMQSTALEPGMASNITFNATATIAVMAGCLNTSSSFTFAPGSASQSRDVISCLQALPMETLLNVTSLFISETTALTDGDVFLPTVDQDFLPCVASELVSSGQFPTMPIILGWEEDDGTLFTPPTLSTPEDTQAYVSLFWPNLNSSTVSQLLELYPSTDFQANALANLSAEFYRGAAIFRDIVFVCPSLFFGHAMAVKYSTSPIAPPSVPVYLFDNNQTVLAALFASPLLNMPGLGVMHGSEMFYLYDDFSLLADAGIPGYTFSPTAGDYALESQLPRSWTSFAWADNPSLARGSNNNNNTLPGWTSAYPEAKGSGNIYVIGGAKEGMAGVNGTNNSQIKKQRLGTRCGFLNSAPVIEQLKY